MSFAWQDVGGWSLGIPSLPVLFISGKMENQDEITRQIQEIENKVDKLNAYYQHKVDGIKKKGKERIAKMNQEWKEEIKRTEIDMLRVGRKEIEKKVKQYLKKATQRKKRILEKKINKRDLKKVVDWFISVLQSQ